MRKLPLVVAALFLVGCSGGDNSDGFSTPEDVANAAGCSGYHPDDTDELFVKEQGKCRIGGSEITIDTFASSDAVASFYDVASEFGGLYLVGDTWIITGSRGALEEAQDNLGSGELK